MEKFKNFFNTNSHIILTVFMLLVLLQTCTLNSNLKLVRKEMKNTKLGIDTLTTQLRKEMEIEGLKSEKRMIQATDRKLMDVQRQTQIEQEINLLENK
jgi:hypothetical protein